MPYINIHEYDNTITGPKNRTGNIVAVPINATDGPSDKWVTVFTYDDFIQTFGPNPSTDQTFGNSWEYAANLLLRNMPVVVRRITHELDENGNNTSDKLANVDTAKAIIKVRDIVGDSTIQSGTLETSNLIVKDIEADSILVKSKAGESTPNPLYKQYINIANIPGPYPSIYDLEMDEAARGIGAFADVIDNGESYPYTSTENEWNYIGSYPNPHYKQVKDENEANAKEYTTLEWILTYNPEGEKGDFYLIEDLNTTIPGVNYCRVDYVNSYENPNLLSGGILTYPSNLLWINPNSISRDTFADVRFDEGNKTITTEKVWKFTNCKFFNTLDEFRAVVKEQKSKDTDELASLINPLKSGDPIYIINERTIYTIDDNLTVNNDLIVSKIVYTEDELNDLSDDITDVYVVASKTNFSRTTGTWKDDEVDKFGVNNLLSFVKNHRYIVNDESDTGFFESVEDLPKTSETLVIPTYSFACVKSEKDNLGKIYYYNSDMRWQSDGSVESELNEPVERTFEDLDEPGVVNYGLIVAIPWINTNKDINTGIYRHIFNWKKAKGNDKNKYFTHIHWEQSNNAINTRFHEVVKNVDVKLNHVTINAIADVTKTSISLDVNASNNDIEIEKDYSNNRLVSGKVGITNNSYEPIKIYSLRLIQKNNTGTQSLIYDAGLEKTTSVADKLTYDALFKINLIDGNVLGSNGVSIKYDSSLDKWYFELDPGATLYYNRNLTGLQLAISFAIFDDLDVVCHLFESSNGQYDICLSSFEIVEVKKSALPEIVIEDDLDNLSLSDGRGNFNLFTAEYIYPGSNGNGLNARVKTIKNQGIYIYIYRGTQYLERIELCSFRRRLNNGRVQIYDLDLNQDDIWRSLLTKFNILVGINDRYELPATLYGAYVKININHNLIDYDSYDYIKSLFAQDGSQIAQFKGGMDADDDHVVHEVPYCYKPLEDKYRYDVTFVSNGGYIDKLVYSSDINSTSKEAEVRLIEDAMLDLANTRKDCVAYLDVPFDLPMEDVPFYFEHISTSYAAAYDPWCLVVLATGSSKWMPPSFIQLYTHAKSILNGNKMYLPPAGVRRALVPEILKTNHDLPSSYITDWQNLDSAQFINPIIWINGYDYTVYGQKTLYNLVNQSSLYESNLQNLNVRLVANYIKKLIFKTCIDLTFELNNMMTWNEFKSMIEPTLSVMQGEGTITTYDILMGTETMTSADLNSGHIVGVVKVAITTAATDWDINFEIQPNSITFYENDYNSSYSG